MTSRLVHDNTEAFYRMSMLYYRMGEAEDSLKYVCINIFVYMSIHNVVRVVEVAVCVCLVVITAVGLTLAPCPYCALERYDFYTEFCL